MGSRYCDRSSSRAVTKNGWDVSKLSVAIQVYLLRPASYLLVFLFALQALTVVASPIVKLSKNGICHPLKSSWYERTQDYTAFKSLESCLSAGGKLPKGLPSKLVEKQESDEYKRSAFGHGWDDANGDCQNSRAEALIATSTTTVRFADERRCRVVTGRWISPFTGNIIQNASNIDIDHVVPLAWAWERGAKDWPKERRELFANDMVNLLPVEASLNRSKGSQGPDEWLPPSGQCGYVARFFRIVKQYGLKPAPNEINWIQSFLNSC